MESIAAERFALGGVPVVADEIAGRLIILPADPDASLIEFDKEFWEFFPNPCPDPVTGGSTDFGREKRSLSECAALYDPDWRDSTASWRSYLALHRSGTLDLTFPESYAPRDGDDPRTFHLIGIVGWTWAAMVRYSEFCRKYEIPGPFEIVLALRETSGAALGGFGRGGGTRSGTRLRHVTSHCASSRRCFSVVNSRPGPSVRSAARRSVWALGSRMRGTSTRSASLRPVVNTKGSSIRGPTVIELEVSCKFDKDVAV